MPGEALRRTEGRHQLAEQPPQGGAFGQVVVRRRRAVCVDVVHALQPAPGQRFGHGAVRPLARLGRSGLVVGVVGVGVPRKAAVGAHARFFARKDDISRPFAQIQPCARGVERAAPLPVENRERVESVEREAAQCVGASGHDIIGHVVFEQQGSGDDGVRGRRAGRADGRRVTRDAAVLRDPAGAVGAVVPRH